VKGFPRLACQPASAQAQMRSIVGGFSSTLALARAPEFTVSLLWRPWFDADPGHRWLRGCVREVCAEPVA
jgi:hypothetical protein